jgi:DtxR family transcriptional regulator, Mn-dependent transcriptional regulator
VSIEPGYHTPLEEYLETIQSLADEGTEVIGARIAERLGRTAPSVKEMLDRLEKDGYVVREGRVVELTEQGRDVAMTVTRRHRLAERLLVDVIGLEWHKVHLEAGRWEHVISKDVEEKLVALLGDPDTCPHGNPIPGAGSVRLPERRLSGARPGEVVELVRLNELVEHDEAALVAMDEAGFRPGSTATVISVRADGTLELEARSGRLVLGAPTAQNLFIAA